MIRELRRDDVTWISIACCADAPQPSVGSQELPPVPAQRVQQVQVDRHGAPRGGRILERMSLEIDAGSQDVLTR